MAEHRDASALIGRALEGLDIPREVADRAVSEYERVARWLGEEDSPIARYDPVLYPQGSFRLGTPVRPLLRRDEFDIDLVCRLDLSKEQISQADLKALVGDRLRSNRDLKERLDESRRCWTLSFQPEFHLDVLPSIPDRDMGGSGILLSDTDLFRWQFSNPIGYADWFIKRMEVVLLEARASYAAEARVSIEDVPEWRVRTPLQRAVQMLKRHRDIRFSEEPENRPVSIIITTLAGRAYREQRDLTSALIELVAEMPAFIERRGDKWWVENPAHPEENFADKWNEKPERRDAFLRWLDDVRNDLVAVINAGSEDAARQLVESRLLTVTSGSDITAHTAAVAPLVDDLSHLQRPPWPDRSSYSCLVSATIHKGFRAPGVLRKLGSFVYKNAGICFHATTDATEPYEVKWQITNSGPEARRAGQLRGGFDDGEGRNGTNRWDVSRYGGTHFVQAFVIKEAVIVAKSDRIPVRIPR